MTAKSRDQRPPMLYEAYDDDECHDFLVYELGPEVPTFFRYAEGIHEVQKRLILRYGDENMARAMGVFKELLEEDDASGLGDDGDLWRSWRHDHKHWRVSCSNACIQGVTACEELLIQVKENFSNPGTPKFPGVILPSPVARTRRVTAMSPSYEDSQHQSCSAPLQDDSSSIKIGLSVAADDPRRCPPSSNLTQPSEAAWLAQTYGGAPKDYEGDFEDRVNKINNSRNMSTTAMKQEKVLTSMATNVPTNVPMRRPSMRKIVAKRVSTLFNKDDRGTRKHTGASRDDKDSARSRKPELPPLSFDGAGDEPDRDSTCCNKSTIGNLSDPSSSPYTQLLHTNEAADETESRCNLHSVNLKRALPSPSPMTRQPRSSMTSTDTPTSSVSEVFDKHPSIISTAPLATGRSITSSRHKFRNLTRELVLPATPNRLSEVQSTVHFLEPEKFDPSRSGSGRAMEDV